MLQRGAITPLYVPENGYGCLERLPTAPKQVPLEQRGDLAATTPPAGPTQGLPEGHSCWDELGFPTSLARQTKPVGVQTNASAACSLSCKENSWAVLQRC